MARSTKPAKASISIGGLMLVLYLVHFAIYHNFDLHSVPKQPDITVTCPGTPAQPTGEQCWYYDSHGAIHYVPANQTHP